MNLPLRPPPIARQVETIAALKPGWLNGEGPAYDAEQLAWLAEQLDAVVEEGKLPSVYPTAEGHVLAEWSADDWEVAATFDLGAKEAHLLAVSVKSNAKVERVVALKEPGAEGALAGFLREHLRSPSV